MQPVSATAKLRPGFCCSQQKWPVKCVAASSKSSGVRVTKFSDGSVTYHFRETADRQDEVERLQQPESSLALISSQQGSFNSNGSAAEALQHQEPGPDIATLRVTTAVLTDPRQQQSSLEQEQGQNGAASSTPTWSLNLEWDSQDCPEPAGKRIAIEQPAPRDVKQTAKNFNGKHRSAQPADPPGNLDSRLDFDHGDAQTLLRAYNSRVAAGRLHAALEVLETLVAAGRIDVLRRCDVNASYLMHRHVSPMLATYCYLDQLPAVLPCPTGNAVNSSLAFSLPCEMQLCLLHSSLDAALSSASTDANLNALQHMQSKTMHSYACSVWFVCS